MLSARDQLFLDKVDKFCALSQWHMDFASNYHKIPKDKMAIMANGIEFNRFDKISVERNPYRFHWSSSWDRGLDNVLYLWPFIKEKFPLAELHIFYGTHNWAEMCRRNGDTEGLKKIHALEEAVKQSGIYSYGRVNQYELAEAMKKSSIWLYPTFFSESFCVTAIECQRAGVPIICPRYAGLTTTLVHPELGDTAVMLGEGETWWPYTKEGREQFLEQTISILSDHEKWQTWSKKGFENSMRFSWTNVAHMWRNLFQ
jgi:glycosyltransferase involved in cell wall biosynthesis